MADISELVVRLRALALKFRNLGTYTGEYFYEIHGDAVVDANALVEEIYDAGFLLSIEGMSEVRNRIETSKSFSLTKISLFDIIVGFTWNPEPTMIEEVWTDENGDRDVLVEYWFVEPGLLKQNPIYIKEWRPTEQDYFQKRHGFELCDRCARGCEMLIEVIEREVAAHKPIQQADDGEDDDGIPRLALQAVIDGGDAGLINQAIKVPATERYSATMMKMLAEDRKYYEWGLDDWAIHFSASRKTIQSTDAWRYIMAYRERQKQNRSKE